MSATTQQRFADKLSIVKKHTGVSQNDFDLIRETAPKARDWSNEVAEFFLNTRSMADRESLSKDTLVKQYLSFFDAANDDDVFWQKKAPTCTTFIQGSNSNEFIIGFSAMLITAYGPKDGMKFAAAFKRILKTGLFLQTETILK